MVQRGKELAVVAPEEFVGGRGLGWPLSVKVSLNGEDAGQARGW